MIKASKSMPKVDNYLSLRVHAVPADSCTLFACRFVVQGILGETCIYMYMDNPIYSGLLEQYHNNKSKGMQNVLVTLRNYDYVIIPPFSISMV
jgi:hypothetical protein